MTPYDKPFKTYDELIDLLRQRNVIISDEKFVTECLKQYSYYSMINAYKNLFPVDDQDRFIVPVVFFDFYYLTLFDRELNNVLFKYIIMLEKKLKSNISYRISEKYGVFTDLNDLSNSNVDDYLCKTNYQNRRERNNVLKSIKNDVLNSKNESVGYYLVNHNHIPCWILTNGISFGRIIQYYGILNQGDKEYICDQLFNNDVLSVADKKEFLRIGLNIARRYRNNIAHGNKLFSNFVKEQLPKRQVLMLSQGHFANSDYKKGIGKNDLFAIILIICVTLEARLVHTFITEINRSFETVSSIIFSNGKNIYDLLGLPTNFISILRQISSHYQKEPLE